MKVALHLAAAFLLAAACSVYAAQKGKPEAAPKAAAKMPGPKMPAPKAPGAGGNPKNGRPAINNPLNLPQRLLQMTPEQRDRILEKLPQAQQDRVRQQLERLDHMSPAEKERIARQAQYIAALEPAQRRVVSQAMSGMNQLPADRRGPVRKELLALVNSSEEDRDARLKSEEFKKKFSPDEQKILTDLSTTLPADYFMSGRQ